MINLQFYIPICSDEYDDDSDLGAFPFKISVQY
jgi:hypothetical protein